MLLHDVAAMLVEAGQGIVGDDLFLSSMPTSPDTAVAVYEYPGLAPAYVHGHPDPTEEYPRFQVQIRGAEYDAARLRIERCARALGRVRERVINGTHYHRMTPLGTVAVLEGGESGRVRLALSFEAAKTLSPIGV